MNRLLIANRGEIARRIVRTCRTLGISTVAVFSDADAEAPFVADAELAVRLPGRAARDTYLHADLLVAAAGATQADAVHPGYGFLSEDAAFAQAVIDAGLIWVGPAPKVIAAMGSKLAAKATMAAAGVPVLPALVPAEVRDFPVLVKASAGGGGRGMRVVNGGSELAEAVASAQRDAESAFGDATVFCEPLLIGARHVEVQVLADTHGTVWTLGERDCSIQRRHQKIIEETPSPTVDDELRAALTAVAADAARAIGYLGAGTVEFLLGADGRFYFLETNTRLQVEHPITEGVYGIDVVALQLAIAGGDALPQRPPEPSGHAIEARLYAEDPARGGQPQSGRFTRFAVPHDVAFAAGAGASGVRLDTGVEDGSVVGVDYDALLAKVIAWAPTRPAAIRRLATVLRAARLHGPITNRELLIQVLEHPGFAAGRTDTGFLDEHGLTAPLADDSTVRLSAVAAALARAADLHRRSGILPGIAPGWRNGPAVPRRTGFAEADVVYQVAGNRVTLVDQVFPGIGRSAPSSATNPGENVISSYKGGQISREVAGLISGEIGPHRVVLVRDGLRLVFDIGHSEGHVHVDSPLGPVRLTPLDRLPEPAQLYRPGSLLAPMPGTITRLEVAAGDAVHAGQPLMWLEAMKMEHRVDAPATGVVSQLLAAPGARMRAGDVLAVLTPRRGDLAHPQDQIRPKSGGDDGA